MFVHPPYVPHTLCAFVCSQRLLYVVGGCKRLPYVLRHFPYTTTVWGCLPFSCIPHTQLLASLCISMFQGYPYVMWLFFPSVRGFGDVPPISRGFWGAHQHLYIFVVHYVSCFYYGYNYSSYGGIFWPVISVISDSGSFPNRVSSKLGSVWSGSTTTLDAEKLWRCYWLSFCATAANTIFDASSGLCQLCYGFSTGRFLFQSWASHCFVYYMFGVHSGVCFLL